MPELYGWLLDLFEDPRDGLVLYFIAKDGRRLRLRYDLTVTFFAQGSDARLRELWHFLASQKPKPTLSRDVRRDVFTRRDETVLAAQFRSSHEQRRIFEKAVQNFPDLNYADADIQPSLRFTAATGAFPTALCHAVIDDAGNLLSIQPLESQWELTPSDIPLRIMSLNPDENPSHTRPHKLRVEIEGTTFCLDLEAERVLLINLRALLQRYDPDVLLTEWGDTWLLPYLLEISQKYGIDLPLNRESGVKIRLQKERSYFSYGQIIYRGQTVQLFGRCHIDRHNAVLWKDYEMDGILENCRVTALPLQTSSRTSPGTGISSIEILTAMREGILVPWQKQQAEMLKPASEIFLADQGGLVYQPKVGVHTDVAEIDFVSLYPAIMVYFNISPETILNDPTSENLVPTLGMGIDNSQTGLIPKSLKPLLMKRVSLKTELMQTPAWNPNHTIFTRRASALKWLLVTCFGYLGYKNARFGRIEAHQAVTAYGREVLLRAKEAAEALGFEVLHLYVDALWVRKVGKKLPSDFEDLLAAIQDRTRLPIMLDGVYRWLVFVPSRQNINRPVPNRYFGLFQDGSIKMRGIDARRRDAPPFVAQSQKHILDLLAKHDNPNDAILPIIRFLQLRLRQLYRHEIPLQDLLVRQRLGRELSAYRTLPAAARAARQLEAIGKTLRPGQSVIFLHMLGNPGVHAWDLEQKPNPEGVDFARYQELLLRAASTVLQPWLGSEENLKILVLKKGEQLTLPPPLKQHPVQHSCNIPRIIHAAMVSSLQG